ncbi:MAG: CrcB family protein [Candidatus Thalassarchaeaceae archaeon]|nr:CrcB family protein [Candidatus Thalassarchaeaceae archaeon]
MDLRLIVIVAFGGAIGAVLRYALPSLISNQNSIFITLGINLLGSLLLGILFGLLATGSNISEELVLLIGTGFIGAFTTMSAFAFEAMETSQNNAIHGLSYILSTVFGSIFLAWLGYSVILHYSS